MGVSKKKKIIFIIIVVLFLLAAGFDTYYFIDKHNKEVKKTNKEHSLILKNIKANYNTYVKIVNETALYKKEKGKYVLAGSISGDMNLILEDKKIKDYKDEYFKIKDLDYYVKYTGVTKIDEFTYDTRFTNYIPFNKNVVTEAVTRFYSDNGDNLSIKEGIDLPLLINDIDKYYVAYNNQLFYIKKDEATLKDNSNTQTVGADRIPVVLYHYVYNDSNKNQCSNTVICSSIAQVDEHYKYLKDHNYYTTTMLDLDLWLDGKINLPKNSITITIDDGWFVDENLNLLRKYDLHATLFMITSLYKNAKVYNSKYIETHSHTDNLHYTGACPGGQGSPIKCLDRNKILTDLKLSREKLDNTTYFSWPFYEYNDYSMNLLKEAGFTMAFKGGREHATKGINKFLVPRKTIHNTTSLSEFISMIS